MAIVVIHTTKSRFRASLCACAASVIVSACANYPSCGYVEKLQTRATAGDMEAQYYLGNLHKGITPCLPTDHTKRIEWYQRAAAQGYGDAILQLADSYLDGSGVEQDVGESIRLYQQAAAKGKIQALRKLGDLYYMGRHVPKDLGEAEKWYSAGAVRQDEYSKKGLKLVLGDKYPERVKELEEEREREVLDGARNLFGTITLVLPKVDLEIDAPTSRATGLRYKGLKAIGSIPASFAVYGYAGILVAPFMPFAVLSAPGKRKVRRLQDEFAAAYEQFADQNLLTNLEEQLLIAMKGGLPNRVVSKDKPDSNDPEGPGNIDTTLRIDTIISGLTLVDAEDARALFVISVRYQVIRSSDGVVVTEDTIGHSSRSQDYAEWTRNEGSNLRREMQTGYSELAKRILNNLWEVTRSRLNELL